MRYITTLLLLFFVFSASAQRFNPLRLIKKMVTPQEIIAADSVKVDSTKVDTLRVDSLRVDSLRVDSLAMSLIPADSIKIDSLQTDSVKMDSVTPPFVRVRRPIKEHLAQPAQTDWTTTVNETVFITEQGDASTIIEKNLKSEPKNINGYRIVVFMNNSQSARRDAVAIREGLAVSFPQEPSYLTYENPYFKVSVGNCSTPDEAIILLGKLRKEFPKAFIVRESINIEEFAK